MISGSINFKNVLNEQERQEIDMLHGNYSVEEIKEFILKNSILSQEDFFTELCFLKLRS